MSIDFNCHLKNVFDGKAEADVSIGGLSTFKVGDDGDVPAMSAKGAIADDGKPAEIKAAIQGFSWDGCATSPMVIDGVVNNKGKAALETVKVKSNKLQVSFDVKILKTADDDSSWFTALEGKGLAGVLDKNTGLGALSIGTERVSVNGCTETLYPFSITISPDVKKSQQATYSPSKEKKVQMHWGQISG